MGLKVCRFDSAEALQRVVGIRTVCGVDNSVILILQIVRARETRHECRLSNGASKKTVVFSTICNELKCHRSGTGRFTMEDDMLRITAKLFDVFLDPFEEESLIHQSCVEVAIFLDLFGSEEPKHANTVVEVYKDDVVV